MRAVSAAVLGILLVAPVLGAAPQVTPSNQVAYYAYDEAAGPTAADSSGSNYPGTHQPGVQVSAVGDCAPVPFGNQRSIILPLSAATGGSSGFLGTGAYVQTPDTPAHNFTGPFTATAWIKPATFAAGNNPQDRGAIIYNWNWVNPPGVFNGYGVDRRLDGRINFYTGTTAVMETLSSNAAVPLDQWSHVAAVFDGSNKRIYINGVQDISVASTLVPGASTAAFRVGKDDYWRNFYGNVDEVRLFNVALSAAEVAVLHGGMATPAGVAATPGVNSVTVTWNAVTGALSYTVQRAPASAGPWTDIGSTASTSFTDTTAQFPSQYYYRVIAVGPFGMNSPPSAGVSGIPISPIPRTNDHDEGLFGDRCSCGASASSPALPALLGMLAVLLGLARRRA